MVAPPPADHAVGDEDERLGPRRSPRGSGRIANLDRFRIETARVAGRTAIPPLWGPRHRSELAVGPVSGIGAGHLERTWAEAGHEEIEAFRRGNELDAGGGPPTSGGTPIRPDPAQIAIGTGDGRANGTHHLDRDRLEALGRIRPSSPRSSRPDRQGLDQGPHDRPEMSGPAGRMPEFDGNDPWIAPHRERLEPQRTGGTVAPAKPPAEAIEEIRERQRDRLAVGDRSRERNLDRPPALDRERDERLVNPSERLVEPIERRRRLGGDRSPTAVARPYCRHHRADQPRRGTTAAEARRGSTGCRTRLPLAGKTCGLRGRGPVRGFRHGTIARRTEAVRDLVTIEGHQVGHRADLDLTEDRDLCRIDPQALDRQGTDRLPLTAARHHAAGRIAASESRDGPCRSRSSRHGQPG